MAVWEAIVCINTEVNISSFSDKSNLLLQKEQLCTYNVKC